MIEIESYRNIEKAKIPVNNKNSLQMEFIKTNNNNNYLKVTRLNEKNEKEHTEFISESDLVLLWNLYLYKKENKEQIF